MPALFYHLTQSRLEDTVALLLGRALGQGWRICLRGPEGPLLPRLDDWLWTRDEADFLPHGPAGGPHDAEQPVLLTTGMVLANDPRALMAVGGAEVTAEEAGRLERVWILFDGLDPPALSRARDQWRALTGAGVSAQYWSEEGGRWEKKTER